MSPTTYGNALASASDDTFLGNIPVIVHNPIGKDTRSLGLGFLGPHGKACDAGSVHLVNHMPRNGPIPDRLVCGVDQDASALAQQLQTQVKMPCGNFCLVRLITPKQKGHVIVVPHIGFLGEGDFQCGSTCRKDHILCADDRWSWASGTNTRSLFPRSVMQWS